MCFSHPTAIAVLETKEFGAVKRRSLLLTTCRALLLAFAARDLAQHHDTVAVHECDTRQALAILECIANQWLLWLEGALGHLVRLQRVWVFHLFATGFLPHLPHEL